MCSATTAILLQEISNTKKYPKQQTNLSMPRILENDRTTKTGSSYSKEKVMILKKSLMNYLQSEQKKNRKN